MKSYEEALRGILAIPFQPGTQVVRLEEAVGRWLAEDIASDAALPRFDNSSMDGFAIRSADAPGTMALVGESAAGRPFEGAVGPGEAVRISTGAPVPAGADAVVPRERAEDLGDSVAIAVPAKAGQCIRRRGEDIAEGQELLSIGTRLSPARMAAIGMLNRPAVRVFERPKAAIFTSGDEIRPIGARLEPGQIVGVNNAFLAAELSAMGCETRDFGVSPDDPAAFLAMAAEALDWADFVVTSAGVSVGDHDVVGAALDSLGAEVLFWRVAVRPGKPMLAARVGGKPWFGLPGNPVSVWANTEIFLKPFLRHAFRSPSIERPMAAAYLAKECPSDPERLFFVASRIEWDEGEPIVEPLGNQSSGNFWNAAWANALVVVPPGDEPLAEGDEVDVLLLEPGQ